MSLPVRESPASVCPLGKRDTLAALGDRERRITFARLRGRPFTYDPDGRPHGASRSSLIRMAVGTLEALAEERVRRETPDSAPPHVLEERVARARNAACGALVSRLNEAIGDPAYHVKLEDLLDTGRSWSREFELFVNVACRDIAEDRAFYWKRGAAAASPRLATLFRAFPIRRIYEAMPRVTSRFLDTDLAVLETSDTHAVLRWSSEKQREGLPPELLNEWLEMSCPAFCGAYASIPERTHPGLAPSTVTATSCQRQGASACEWTFRWKNPVRRSPVELALGTAASLATAFAVYRFAPDEPALYGLWAIPLLTAALARSSRRLARERDRSEAALAEVRSLADTLGTELEAAREASHRDQDASVRRGLALETLAAGSRDAARARDAEAATRAVLRALTSGMSFDRVVVLRRAEDGTTLLGEASEGASAEAARRVRESHTNILDAPALLARLDARDAGTVPAGPLRETPLGFAWLPLAVKELAVAPLVARGRTVGLLVADHAESGRAVSRDDLTVLTAAAGLLSFASKAPETENVQKTLNP